MCSKSRPRFFPETISLENFREVLGTATLPKAFLNSLIVAMLTTVLSLVLAVPAAYVATQYRRPITVLFLLFALVTRMVPAVSLGVPLFQLLKSLGLLDTTTGLVLAHTSTAVPLALLLMAAFFEGVPKELEEAARMDGCTRFQAFLKIILPVMKPGIAITALFSFIASWNGIPLCAAADLRELQNGTYRHCGIQLGLRPRLGPDDSLSGALLASGHPRDPRAATTSHRRPDIRGGQGVNHG